MTYPSRKITKNYLKALEGLYSDIPTTYVPPKKKKSNVDTLKCVKTADGVPTEHQEQVKFVRWLDKEQILYYAIPNAGRRSMIAGMRMKHEGMKAGVPDVCICEPSHKGHHGLYIELKRKKFSTVSVEQSWWINQLEARGYMAKVAYGYEEAVKITMDYFCRESTC